LVVRMLLVAVLYLYLDRLEIERCINTSLNNCRDF
jgi:hypothetical protein